MDTTRGSSRSKPVSRKAAARRLHELSQASRRVNAEAKKVRADIARERGEAEKGKPIRPAVQVHGGPKGITVQRWGERC